MKTNQKSAVIYGIAAILLAIPSIAMLFSDQVKWSASDFVIAGILLFITAFGIDMILKKVKVPGKRFLYISITLIIFFLIWAELAVGIFGTPFAGS